MDIEPVRKNFPYLDTGIIYFNHSSLGPLSNSIIKRINEFIIERSTEPIDNFQTFLHTNVSAKEKLGLLLNCEPERIAWTDNVSNALNILAQGFKFNSGDRIILFENEFPSNIYPFLNLRNNGVELDFIKQHDGKYFIEDIEDAITDRTKLLSISLVQFLSGFRADLTSIGKLCKTHNITYCVDAIQGAGVVPIDVKKSQIDFIAGGAQKWLMSLQGTSYFYISEELQSKIQQKHVGWTSVNDAWNLTQYDLSLRKDASKFQTGTLNTIGITALDESLNLFIENGIKNIEKRIVENTVYFREKLKDNGVKIIMCDAQEAQLAGIISCIIPEIEKTFAHLLKRRINCSLRQGLIRFAPHFYNTKDEIDFVINDLKQFIR